MKQILEEIQTGQFAREFVGENQTGRTVMKTLRERGAEHQIEIRSARSCASMMPFVSTAREKAEGGS